MKTFVKFCGLTSSDHFDLLPPGGAAGFVVEVSGSPRSVSIERATALVSAVPQGTEAWAVVVDPTVDRIHALFDEVGVDRIQVYGTLPEGLDFLERHHLVPSFPLPPDSTALPALPPAEEFPRIHLDASGSPARPGGNGRPANWESAAALAEAYPGRKLILAGGLTAENVGPALDRAHPWGIDTSSGIESSPGVKDPERMRAFLRAVDDFERSHA
ncbi:MAG: phosphoribosylanthranilate isomerase [Thermoplasmata archaeon]